MPFVTVFDAASAELDPGAASPILIFSAGVLATVAVATVMFGFRRLPVALLLAGPLGLVALQLYGAHTSKAVRHACAQTARQLVSESSFASAEGDVTDVVPIKRTRGGGTGTSFAVDGHRYFFCGEIEMDRSLAARAGKVAARDHVRLTYVPETRSVIRLEIAVGNWSPRAVP